MEPRNTVLHDATTKNTSKLEMKLGSNSPPAKIEDKSIKQIFHRVGTESDLNNEKFYASNELSGRGTKRDRLPAEESSSGSSSQDDFSYAPPKNDIKLASVLVRPDRDRSVDLKALEEKRKAILESQRSDKNATARNRRMFGMLLGTLQQFKAEESGREKSASKRSKVEERLELVVDNEEASKITRGDETLSNRRRPSQVDEDISDRLDLRLDAMDRFKNWEKTHRHFSSFIRTEAKPKIFWLPKQHNSITEKRLKETRDYFSLCVAERTAKYKKEMADLGYDQTGSFELMQSEIGDHKDNIKVGEEVKDVDNLG